MLALIAGVSSQATAQSWPVIGHQPNGGFNTYERVRDSVRIAIVEPVAEAVQTTLVDPERGPILAYRQQLRVLNPAPGTPETLSIVMIESLIIRGRLPLGAKYLLLYLVPKDGKALTNQSRFVTLSSPDVAAQWAIPTTAERLAEGENLDEKLFGSLMQAIASQAVLLMSEIMEGIPAPAGKRPFGADTQWKITPYLTDLSDQIAGRGGIFNVVFHARLVTWNVIGAGPLLLNALLTNINDERVEDVLTFRTVAFNGSDLGPFDARHPEGQALLMQGAKNARSDTAAALFASHINRPLKEETKLDFLGLLRRNSPKLRAEVCNELARLNGKPERLLPTQSDGEGWEGRVAEMSELWLREYGLGETIHQARWSSFRLLPFGLQLGIWN
ncbi:MAG: hypothetical protein WD716_04575 [Fimbriimonadaceae bacterium]